MKESLTALANAQADWYPVAMHGELADGETRHSRLLATNITLRGGSNGALQVSAEGKSLAVQTAFDHVWTSLADNPRSLFHIAEAYETERTFVPCGVVRVKCSPLRAVENFLDIAHFPFVHTDVLGAEPHTEVYKYDVNIDENDDEVIATNIKFYQPQASKSAAGGIQTQYTYRVPAPMVAILYKTCPPKPECLDVIALFVQPLDEETCDVLQDRSILENQIPRKLPLDPGSEIPTRADLTSIAYRRWLRRRSAHYGAIWSE